jgi:hypothetical protein
MPKGKCIVQGCDGVEHSRGYCRKHYGRMWRGKELEPKVVPKTDLEIPDLADVEAELAQMRALYERVVGFEGRVRWSKMIREREQYVRKERERIGTTGIMPVHSVASQRGVEREIQRRSAVEVLRG